MNKIRFWPFCTIGSEAVDVVVALIVAVALCGAFAPIAPSTGVASGEARAADDRSFDAADGVGGGSGVGGATVASAVGASGAAATGDTSGVFSIGADTALSIVPVGRIVDTLTTMAGCAPSKAGVGVRRGVWAPHALSRSAAQASAVAAFPKVIP
jgi:hypothetical protein